MLLDHVMTISSYPQKGRLETVTDICECVGGCVPNVLIDLARMDSKLELCAFGRVGRDAAGQVITGKMEKAGVDVSKIVKTDTRTSFTDVISEKSGERTFFHYRGANAEFCPEDITELDCEMLHIGYMLLLDKFDEPGVMPEFLKKVREKGIYISADVVSENSNRYKEIVRPSLKYIDCLVVNETEAGQISGIEARKNGRIDKTAIYEILSFLAKEGVSYAVVHCPEAGFSLNNGKFTVVPSLELPKEYIKGTVGAGDAFCAGVLYGIASEFSDEQTLAFASLSAAANLSSADSVGGARSYDEIIELETRYKRKGRLL